MNDLALIVHFGGFQVDGLVADEAENLRCSSTVRHCVSPEFAGRPVHNKILERDFGVRQVGIGPDKIGCSGPSFSLQSPR
jgi:hypothetical protein